MPIRKQTAAKKRSAAKKPAAKRKQAGIPFYWRFTLGCILLLVVLSPFYYGYVVKTFTSTLRWLKDLHENPNYRTYQSFAIHIPTLYHLHGIDVSYAQGRINWPMVRAMREDSVHISFAFIKATEGLLKVDPYFKRNWREAAKAGIICGAYHYFRPERNGHWQARFFLQNVQLESGDLPAVVDIEELDGTRPEAMRKQLSAFLQDVQAKTKVRPIIYTGLSFYADYLAGYYNSYPLWLAYYDEPELKTAAAWQFWQHSETARVTGINHYVDFDAFKGDSLTFRGLLVP